jgi:hypothetical protein
MSVETNNKQERSFDGSEIGLQFIDFFYSSWINNPELLTQIIKEFSKLKYNNTIYEGDNFIALLKSLSNNLKFSNIKYEILDSKSRQIFILVIGDINNNHSLFPFRQSFVVSYAGDKKDRKWILMNSLLII